MSILYLPSLFGCQNIAKFLFLRKSKLAINVSLHSRDITVAWWFAILRGIGYLLGLKW